LLNKSYVLKENKGKSHIYKWVNIKRIIYKVYNSIRGTVKDIGVSHPIIINNINKNKLLKSVYLIIKKENKI
jgi:hypothetical protein